MIDVQSALLLLTPGRSPSTDVLDALHLAGFEKVPEAVARFQSLCPNEEDRLLCAAILPGLLYSLSEAASADNSLLNFQRLMESSAGTQELLKWLGEKPRAVDILVRLFVGSQFLTEILIRNPHYLHRLTEHKRLAEFKSRAEFVEQGTQEIPAETSFAELMNHLRRFQQWELLRLAACDTFGLMDLRTVTLQLSLLADSLIQISLQRIAEQEGISLDDFSIIAMGKLGGEELNYSSDIDLVFVCEREAERYWNLGQKLIRALSDSTDQGFLYRVDMRLRPWGSAGPLVTTVNAWEEYLTRHGQLWEKQALLKARPIAGNLQIGEAILKRLEPCLFDVDIKAARKTVRESKRKIEEQLVRKRVHWGEVKGGPGGIRDIEFVVQFLQLAYGKEVPDIRSINTLDGLVRLADFKLIFPDEFRRLTDGYLVLRTIEHALQLFHNLQEHALPRSERRLAYLARRLDFPDAETFLKHYEQHAKSVREVFERYLDHEQHPLIQLEAPPALVSDHLGNVTGSYRDIFSKEDEQLHISLFNQLTDDRQIRVAVQDLDSSLQQVTIAGLDRIGALSAICGLMCACGTDIVSGNVLTGTDVDSIGTPRRGNRRTRKFVNVFTVRPASSGTSGSIDWNLFEDELNDLVQLAETSGWQKAQGKLAHRVAEAVYEPQTTAVPLLPVEIDLDNIASRDATVLHIRGKDTPGFLYELTNAITTSGLSIARMTIQSSGPDVVDTLHVVDEQHRPIQSQKRLNELRAAIVLIKHFTHLLPSSPNPASALVHFQEFLENLFQRPDWLEELSPLKDSEVLGAMATLLGVSDFLWGDFLRLQHANLFPVVTNVKGLQRPRNWPSLMTEWEELRKKTPLDQRIEVLNQFKDREMMRADMRHILGLQDKFGMFGIELTDVAEVVVEAARQICEDELQAVHGHPQNSEGAKVFCSICGLGKCGGQELGYASDIELMFLYQEEGMTSGPHVITNAEYFQRLAHLFRRTIRSKRKGIFEIDLRLRPYGKAGPLAVSLHEFESYFGPSGAAWPYERQALVKLRPIAGDAALGKKVVALRDRLIYRGEPFDV
ncbi:MAG TPA: glutamine synthetase adenylyltransferase, partial [Planctomicrobium sp.]|nr:glutamine synthetase adenylyltransferase [Planctomicrobium sp.]